MRRYSLCISAFVISALVFAASAQKKPSDKNLYPLSGPVIVKANLLVLDADGKYVEGLSDGDVKIFEDGTEQKITFFKYKIPPLGLGLVIDNSGSLRTQIDQLLKAAKIITANLADGDQGFVIRFISSEKIEVVQDFTRNKKEVIEAIDSLYVEGGRTAMIDAISLAVESVSGQEKRTPENRFAIVVLSDGTDVDSYYDLAHLHSLTEKSDVQIFPVFFTGELTDEWSSLTRMKYARSNAERLANVLALKTGGAATVFGKKPSEAEMLAALKQVIIEVRSQYIVGYTSTNPKRDGLPRKLTVQIKDDPNGKKRSGFIRESFVVPLD